jgi:hypothetical protein
MSFLSGDNKFLVDVESRLEIEFPKGHVRAGNVAVLQEGFPRAGNILMGISMLEM